MNILWPFLIIISYAFAVFSGNIEKINNSIFSSVSDVIELTMVLTGNTCLWCGVLNIVKNTKIILWIKRILKPLLKWMFPNEKNDKNVMNEISINFVSNLLGIGNAATPAGLKAMELMQKKNLDKNKITDSMAMLIVTNTTSIQLIPSTVIGIRAALHSQNPSEIIVPIWISTIAGTLTAIIINKIIVRLNKKKERT